MALLEEFAPAKINLFLHVLGRWDDGYHRLESLVGFAGIGDALVLEPGGSLALAVDGPFAPALAGGGDNLILQAARLFAEALPRATLGAFRLTKRLPVASGIGGGSSDAAAALRLLADANGIDRSAALLTAIARKLGADVPVCLDTRPRLMHGIGHDLGPALGFSEMPALLVNPRVAVETRAVFARLGLAPGGSFGAFAARKRSAGDDPIAEIARTTRNDLEPPARALAPVIGQVIAAIGAAPGCRLARMSGSGATGFGLFASTMAAERAAAAILADHPAWWAVSTTLQVPLSAANWTAIGG